MSDPTQPRQRITDGAGVNIGTVWWDGDEVVAEDDRWRIQSRHKGLTAVHSIQFAVAVIRCRVRLDSRLEAEQCGRLHQIAVEFAIANVELAMFAKKGDRVGLYQAQVKIDELAAEVEAMQAARKAAAS